MILEQIPRGWLFLKYISCDPGADPPGVIFFLNIYPVILEQSSWLWAAKLECIVLQPAFRVQFYTSHEISCLAPLSPMLFHHMLNQIVHSQPEYFCRAPALAGNNVQLTPIVTSVSSLHFYKQTFRIGNQSNGSG